MGGVQSQPQTSFFVTQISRAELDLLAARTHYTESEIQQLYSQFMTEVPAGVVPASTFSVVAMSLGIQDPVLYNLLFNAFDLNGDGMISFHEFITGMSTMTRGANDEKVQFAFRMYDLHRLGYLSRESLLPVVESLKQCFGPLQSYPSTASPRSDIDVRHIVDNMMTYSDQNGRLSYGQFRDYCHRNPSVVRGLALS